jgi:hypothetical protein
MSSEIRTFRLTRCLLAAPIAIAAAGPWLWSQRNAMRRRGLRVLLPVCADTLVRCARAFVGAPVPEVPWESVGPRVDGYLASFRSPRRWRLQTLMVAVEFGPWLLGLPRFSRMDDAARAEFCRNQLSAASGIWCLVGRVRQLARLGYYGAPETHRRMGFVGFEERRGLVASHGSATNGVAKRRARAGERWSG